MLPQRLKLPRPPHRPSLTSPVTFCVVKSTKDLSTSDFCFTLTDAGVFTSRYSRITIFTPGIIDVLSVFSQTDNHLKQHLNHCEPLDALKEVYAGLLSSGTTTLYTLKVFDNLENVLKEN